MITNIFFDFFELMIVQIIFSYSAIESFCNVMINQTAPENYIYSYINRNKKIIECDKTQTEHASLREKLDFMLPKLLEVKSLKGTDTWSKFRRHANLRIRLIHLKSIDMNASRSKVKTIWRDLIRNHQVHFPQHACKILEHYLAKNEKSRWCKKITNDMK